MQRFEVTYLGLLWRILWEECACNTLARNREREEEKEIERVSEGVCVCVREREGMKNYKNG